MHNEYVYLGHLGAKWVILYKYEIRVKKCPTYLLYHCMKCGQRIQLIMSLEPLKLEGCHDAHYFHRKCLKEMLRVATNGYYLLPNAQKAVTPIQFAECSAPVTDFDIYKVCGNQKYRYHNLDRVRKLILEKQRCLPPVPQDCCLPF